MVKRIPWDMHETTLLIEAYFWIQDGYIDKSVAIEIISEELRRKAQLAGYEIDDIYRNLNGIRMQMLGIQYIVTNGKTGLRNRSKLFVDIVNLYNDKPEEFKKILQEAKKMIEENDLHKIMFDDWISKCIPLGQANWFGDTLRILNVMGRKQHLFKGTLLQIDSVEELSSIRNKIVSNNALNVQRKKLYDFDKFFRYYGEYLKEQSHQENSVNKIKREINVSKISTQQKVLLKIEDDIKQAELEGLSAQTISAITGKSVRQVKLYMQTEEYVIEMPDDTYVHVDSIIDIEEKSGEILAILQSQFEKFGGYTNDVVLFSAATNSLGMFLNDNSIDTPGKLYGVARYLFEKKKFSGYNFVFGLNKHIWKEFSEFAKTNSGVLLNYISYCGGKISKEECVDFLNKVKLPSNNINGLLCIGSDPQILFYDLNEYILTRKIIGNDEWFQNVRNAINRLFECSNYIILREIEKNWFETLPPLSQGWKWSLLLLQDLIKKYIGEYRLITANENQGLETLRAGIVLTDSAIENFADLVFARIAEDNSIQLPVKIQTEELRQILIDYGMIQGNELIYTMQKALNDATKFAWASDGGSVLILKYNG